jgi:DNA-directed RNA polymerase subunit K
MKMQEEFTRYEIARILGARALQIAMDAPLLMDIEKQKLEETKFDPLKIADIEFYAGVLPITVKRPFPKKIEAKLKREKEEEKKEEEKKIEEIEEKEEKDIKEEGEIMETAKPEDEVEEEAKAEEEELEKEAEEAI